MPLTYTQGARTLTGARYGAIGSKSNEQIIVDVSQEVLDDYGEGAAKQKGSEKYDNGDYDWNIVFVRTSDFRSSELD